MTLHTTPELIAACDAMDRPHLPGFIVLGRERGANSGYVGLIEGSFNLDTNRARTQFFWSSDNATSNFGGSFKVDGRVDADAAVKYWSARLPEVTFEVFDVHAEGLPVAIDWDSWRADKAPSERTLSGVVDKFGARNVRFYDRALIEA